MSVLASCAAPAVLVTVLAIVDGDTLRVQANGATDRLRLACIDAPETARPGPADDQPFAGEASAQLAHLVAGATACLESDPVQAPRDRYGRLVGYLTLADGRDAGAEMIRSGHARTWERGRCARKDAYRLIEAEARRSSLGLWRSP